MSRSMRALALLLVLICTSATVADEPKKPEQKPELLPAPKQSAPTPKQSVPSVVITPAYPQPGTREVWQYYAVDSRGRFVPRVLYQPPYGGFYLHDGRPYPFTTTRPTIWMPYVID